ncbi:MAG: LysM peptidoglycan-binding domain-containing protein [Thermaurantimonas sp.]
MPQRILLHLISALLPIALLAQAEVNDSLVVYQDSGIFKLDITDDPFAKALDELFKLNLFTNDNPSPTGKEYNPNFSEIPDSLFEHRIRRLNSQSPVRLTYNREVRQYIEMYLRKHQLVSRMMGLSQLYFPIFEEVFDKYNIPLEIKYLAMVESALNPKATSVAGAQGLWQFIYSTGKLMGLQITSYVDERNDPYKATEAAARFLRQLYKWFNDWDLALAAYNSGPGNVTKAIRRSGGKTNYWELRPFLPRETAGYVPAFIAVNYVIHYAHEHGIYPLEPAITFYDLDTVVVREPIDLRNLAAILDMPVDLLTFLNPQYRQYIVPSTDQDQYFLALPRKKWGLFVSNEDTIYAFLRENSKNLSEAAFQLKTSGDASFASQGDRIIHRVRKGESLGAIARKYNVSMSDIRSWNRLKNNTIHPNQKLTIYRSKPAAASASTGSTTSSQQIPTISHKSPNNSSPSKSSAKVEYYRVNPGDTLYSIARRYSGVSVEDIMAWNNIKDARNLKSGMQLKIYLN